jgi:hypothetical protein
MWLIVGIEDEILGSVGGFAVDFDGQCSLCSDE